MLQNIREKFTGWIAAAILGLIAITFVFVGGANFAFIGNNYAAKVDGVEIGLGQFEQAYRDQLQQNPQFAQLPDNLRENLRRNVLEQLIQQRVIDNYLSEAGYRISDTQLMGMIQQTPDFQVDGKFDIETYRRVLAENGYLPADFERAQRVTLVRNQLQRGIRGSAILAPSSYRRYLNLAGEQRIVALATLTEDTVADEITITDDMVTAYYDNNPTLYQVPESADVRYVEVTRSDVAQSVDVSEQELREYYEFNQDRYLQDEQRRASHILITFGDDAAAAEEQAQALLARIKAGEPFEDLARSNSEDTVTAPQGGDLGTLTRSQMPGDLGSAIFSMEEGAVEGPIETEFGFHIVRLDEIIEQGPLPFEQVRAELTAELQSQKADSLFLEREREMSDALFDADSIDEVANAIGAEVQTVEGFTREGGEPLGDAPEIIDAVFDELVLSGEQLSDVVEVDASRSLVFQVTDHYPATRRPLEEVRDQVVAALRAEQAETLMAEKADEMIAAVEGGAGFAEAAEAIGAEASDPVTMRRNSQDADQFVSVAVFTAAKPTEDDATLGSTRNGEGGYTVFSVESVLPGRPEALPVEQRDAGKAQLTDQVGVGDFIAFVQALREDAEVIINEDALAAPDLL
ncbi:MAG: SurA N-terminal domain-containing protein [Woeseiaceae bacterium]